MQAADNDCLKVQNGLEADFLASFEPFRRPLYGFIRKSLNYSEDADDVFQETLMRALRYFSSYDRKRPFRNWLYSIALNELRKHYRRLVDSARQLPQEFLAGLEAENVDPVATEEARRLHLLAMDLKPAWREVFFLFYQDDFKIAEVAALTGRSAGHVKFILHGCRRAVRKQLGVER